MRSIEEVETAEAVLLDAIDRVEKLGDEGTLKPKDVKEYTGVLQSTVNLLEWFKGADVDIYTDSVVLDKVTMLIEGLDLFQSMELD